MKKFAPFPLVIMLTALTGCTMGIINPDSKTNSSVDTSESQTSDPVTTSSEATSEEITSETTTSEATSSEEESPWQLFWADEFDGTSLNKSNWEAQIGDGSDYGVYQWGNGEAEYYKEENATVGDGVLTITAKKETVGNYSYTSSRLRTKGKVATHYGRIEAKIKLPNVAGCWPAFWMLPENNYQGQGWPFSGEIDIMENKGRQNKITSGALHYSDTGGHTYRTNTITLSTSITEWHVYAIEWSAESIKWFVDDKQYLVAKKEYWHPNGGVYGTDDDAPFNQDFHILLNLAIGGHFDGYTLPADNMLPARMQVDYVRIYKAK